MWSLLVRFFPRLGALAGSPWLWAAGLTAVFAAGVTAGSWTTVKLYKASEVKVLEEKLADQKASARANEATLRAHYEDQLRIERSRVTTREVVKYVEDNRECDLSHDAERMLDAHRQGMPDTAGGTAGSAGASAAAPRVSQRQLVLADADLADRFTACRLQIQRLKEWYEQQGFSVQ